ncbi:MAG: alpha/beta hydrolase, partial [Desulfobacterales bacterium]|nr:alpha/beta hydrolase [Desulfobacterales bacterium]
GDSSQQARQLRPLIRRGYDLISFTFTGHGRSGGRFCLGAARRDCLAVIDRGMRLAAGEGLPLYGVGFCYSATPLLYGAHRRNEPFRKLILVNAVLRIDPGAIWKAFWGYYRGLSRARRALPGLFTAFRGFMEFLFPGVMGPGASFGALQLSRGRPVKIVCQALAADPLKNARIRRTPVLCLHARDDAVLNLFGGKSDEHYRRTVRRVCRQAAFRRLEGDHYLSHPLGREQGLRAALDFLK